MKCVVCKKETDRGREYELLDKIIVPICKKCEEKTSNETLWLCAVVRQLREGGPVYGKVMCGCGENPVNQLTYHGKGIPIFNKEQLKLAKEMYKKCKCRICGQQVRLEIMESEG